MAGFSQVVDQNYRAQLFPMLADTSRESPMAGVLVALLPFLPGPTENLLASIGVKTGKNASIETYAGFALPGIPDTDTQPDGLIVVRKGKTAWSALVVSNTGKADLDPDQVTRCAMAAKQNGIDAVITISNQLAVQPDQSPLAINKRSLGKTALFHWSWSWLAAQLQIVLHENDPEVLENNGQEWLLSEFVQLMKNPGSGIERFAQMSASWKDVVQSAANKEDLKAASPEVIDAVSDWNTAQCDLNLLISTHLGTSASMRIGRKSEVDAAAQLKSGIAELIESRALTSAFTVPYAASDIEVCADLSRKTMSASMRVEAPSDLKTTKARIGWLLKMLKTEDPRVRVQAHWPGDRQVTEQALSVLRATPEEIDSADQVLPVAFDVMLVTDVSRRFQGRRSFVEDLERTVMDFYDLVGCELRPWQPAPPRPVVSRSRVVKAEQPAAIVPASIVPVAIVAEPVATASVEPDVAVEPAAIAAVEAVPVDDTEAAAQVEEAVQAVEKVETETKPEIVEEPEAEVAEDASAGSPAKDAPVMAVVDEAPEAQGAATIDISPAEEQSGTDDGMELSLGSLGEDDLAELFDEDEEHDPTAEVQPESSGRHEVDDALAELFEDNLYPG